MSIFTSPPLTTKYGFKEGDRHLGVWALQVFFDALGYQPGVLDGSFGPATKAAVERYQKSTGATVDGVVGPQTQSRIVRSCVVRAPGGTTIPKGLVEGQISAESGGLIAAANSQVAGGVDLGFTQRRVYGPPFDPSKVKDAINPLSNVSKSAADLLGRYKTFAARVGHGEYAWRLAALGHNWPSAADDLSRGWPLSTTRIATWVPAGTHFPDGTAVRTFRQWAEFYALGSHGHRWGGLVTGQAFGVPVR